MNTNSSKHCIFPKNLYKDRGSNSVTPPFTGHHRLPLYGWVVSEPYINVSVSEALLIHQLTLTLDLLHFLDIQVNWKKLYLIPTQRIQFIGVLRFGTGEDVFASRLCSETMAYYRQGWCSLFFSSIYTSSSLTKTSYETSTDGLSKTVQTAL